MSTEAEKDVPLTANDIALASALAAERNKVSPMVIVPNTLSGVPGVRQAFAALAEETGRILGVQPQNLVLDAAQRAAADRDENKVVPRGDNKAFLQNLEQIAVGKVRCE